MLTSRGWWLVLTVLSLLFLGLGLSRVPLVLVCLTLLCWILGSWLNFAIRTRWTEPLLRVEREVRTQRGPARSLWAGQRVQVKGRLVYDSKVSLPWAWIADRIPILGQFVDGNHQAQGPLSQNEPLEVTYWLECPAAGKLRFDGLRVQIADVHGFFQRNLFVRSLSVYQIYPPLADAAGYSPSLKRHNVLPILGTHRHRRPGSGSELLDLRDYLPGDPPKMIAWKASARRGRLMTKEFESDVPVRCTLFVDVSSSLRVGRPGKNVLAHAIEIAAAVVQASAALKDLTGLCLFDESRVCRLIRPARGASHVHHLLGELALVADLPLESDHVSLEVLLPIAYSLAQEVYPDLLDPEVNAFPFWLPWWAPHPAYTLDLPFVRTAADLPGNWAWLGRQWRHFTDRRRSLVYNVLVGMQHRLSANQRRQYRWRKQLAAILAQRHHLGPGGLARLLEDDLLCRTHLERFLAKHQIAFPAPLYDLQGRYLFSAPQKIDVLVRGLLACLHRGRDNELFVLIVDLQGVGAKLHDLLRAVQIVRARHHRVLVVCAMPETNARRGTNGAPSVQDLFIEAARAQMRQSAHVIQREFARLGVQVLLSPSDEAAALILGHMQQLRTLQRGGV